jgi:hypothetical protein
MERRALFPCLTRVPHFAFSLVAGQGAPPTKKLRPIKPLLGLLMLLCGCGTRHDILHENGSTIRSSSDGLYYWYYHAWKGHYHIEVSSSTSPTGPWTQYPTPILEPDSETFDSQSVACPTVVQEEGEYRTSCSRRSTRTVAQS